MQTIPKYGRIQLAVPDGCTAVTITRPDGVKDTSLTFRYQPTRFVYDEHGYETQLPDGDAVTCFRYTPVTEGVHRFSAQGTSQTKGGLFECTPSEHPGYIGISQKDARYFAADDGSAFVPVGPNLCVLRAEHLPRSREHFDMGDATAWLGMTSYKRWIKRLAENHVNYVRLWLSTPYLDARTNLMGQHDLAIFNRLDAIMELLRAHGIRTKLCFEHFRVLTASPRGIFDKMVIDPDTGRPFESMADWAAQEVWNERWLEDIMPYIARYQNDPAVFAWELWNEGNCMAAPKEIVLDFTRRMIDRIHALSPRNMVVNSLGSYDREEFLADYMIPFRDMDNMPFMQIHRYLDQGAPLSICTDDPVELVADAFNRIPCPDKPCVLNETGAVNDCHTGPFRFYPCDDDGLIFTDLTYAPFFCGAAASGHMWHWEYYIEPKNLWTMYRPFHDMLSGIAVDEEHFTPGRADTDSAHILTLIGEGHALYYIRSRHSSWQSVLRDGLDAEPVHALKLAVPDGRTRLIALMNEGTDGELSCENGFVTLPDFTRGCIVRVDRA